MKQNRHMDLVFTKAECRRGEIIRIVRVGSDVQACAGTHMTSTGKVGPLRIIKTERIQDGVERFEFAAGVAAIMYDQQRDTILSESSHVLRVPAEQLPSTADRFFRSGNKGGERRLKEERRSSRLRYLSFSR